MTALMKCNKLRKAIRLATTANTTKMASVAPLAAASIRLAVSLLKRSKGNIVENQNMNVVLSYILYNYTLPENKS